MCDLALGAFPLPESHSRSRLGMGAATNYFLGVVGGLVRGHRRVNLGFVRSLPRNDL